MDTSWQGGLSQRVPLFCEQLDSSQNHEDWEDWLRWDPGAAEATSPEDGTFNSGSSKNDSPMQDPPFAEFGLGDEEPLVQPFIVSDNEFTFTANDGLSNDPFFQDVGSSTSNVFTFNQPTHIPGIPGLQNLPKLEANPAAWPTRFDGSETGLSLVALATEPVQQPSSAVSFTATTPSQQTSPVSATQNQRIAPSDMANHSKKRGGRKRKADSQLEKGSPEFGEDGEIKTSHNVIEKRYRNNLNDKIVELRNSVPSLRAMGRANGGEEVEDLEGLTPAHKLNKATVMAKATEYIRHLEKRNKSMAEEMAQLKSQLDKVEAAIGKPRDRQGSVSSGSAPVRSRAPSSASQNGAPNFLNVPADQTRFGQPVAQQQYMQSQTQPTYARPQNPPVEAQNQQQQHQINGRGGVMNKIMLGTMAGIMVVEGLGEQQGPEQKTSLSSVPLVLLKRVLQDGSSTNSTISLPDFARSAFIPLIKLALVIGVLLYLLSSLTGAVPRQKQRLRTSTQLPKAPSLASPVEVRRKAWDTAIQTVWVPKHFLLEVVAVGSKMLQLSMRRLIGSEAFTDITGTNKEEEAARIKAWDIAIDAQLAGGDAQVSYYRLLLTLMESGTLPDSPARLMQKAVHFRVFFWEVANAGYGNMVGFKQLTERVGKFYWDSARRLQKELTFNKRYTRSDHDTTPELLPDHLACLVELDCEEVLNDEMIQRAWNLAWNKPSAHKTIANAARDSVVEDHAIRSPLDAVAAWYTNVTIDDTLADALSNHVSTFDTEYYIGLALSVAPPASSTHVRALAAKAVISNSNRDSNIVVALESLPVISPTGGMNLVSHAPPPPDICIALTLAKLISLCSPSASTAARQRAVNALDKLRLAPSSFTLLTSVAVYRLLRTVHPRPSLDQGTKYGLEELAANLRIWVGTSAGRDSGLGPEGRSKLVRLCLHTARLLGGWEDKDSGYASASRSQSPSSAGANESPVAVF